MLLKKASDFKVRLDARRFLLQNLPIDLFRLRRFFLCMEDVHGADETAFDGIESGDGFHLLARVVFVATGNPRSVHFIFGKIAASRNVRGIELHGRLKFLFRFASEREAVFAIRFFAVGAAKPLAVERVFRLELDGMLEGSGGGIEIEEFVRAASEPEMNLGIAGGFFEGGLKYFPGGDIVAGVETFLSGTKFRGVLVRPRRCTR